MTLAEMTEILNRQLSGLSQPDTKIMIKMRNGKLQPVFSICRLEVLEPCEPPILVLQFHHVDAEVDEVHK